MNYNIIYNVNNNSILFTTVYCDILLSKTVSSKIPNKLHEDLRERCNQLGCTINEYVENCIDFLLNNSSEFDFGGNLDEPEITPKPSVIVSEID